MSSFQSIGFVGAGRVATHLARAFSAAGLNIEWIWSRSKDSAERLASEVHARAYTGNGQFPRNTGLIIFSIPDLAWKDLPAALENHGGIMAHTSGSLPHEVLKSFTKKTAVFYPLQTFSLDTKPSLHQVPFCIESDDELLKERLASLAELIGGRTVFTNPQQRLGLHVAAVFACNFTNHMYRIAEELLPAAGLDFSLLHPLVMETASKAVNYLPSKVQTGPAMRNDEETINRHLEYLKDHEDLRNLYSLLSGMIMSK